MVGRGRPTVSGPLDGDGRRSIYLNVRRNFLTPMLLAFDYPTPFTSAIWQDNVFATQFHPEKSQREGLSMLHQFAGLR